VQISDRCAPVKVANSAGNSVLQALQLTRFGGTYTKIGTIQRRLASTQLDWGPRYIAPGRTQQKTPIPTILLLFGIVSEMCLPNHCLAMNLYSDSPIPAFRRHVTICFYNTTNGEVLYVCCDTSEICSQIAPIQRTTL
jgi:hypothetical protein